MGSFETWQRERPNCEAFHDVEEGRKELAGFPPLLHLLPRRSLGMYLKTQVDDRSRDTV